MINPNNIKADKVTKIYPEEVAKRVPKFLLYALIAIAILMTIGIALIQPYVDENGEGSALSELKHIQESDIEIHPIKKSNSFKISSTNFSLGSNENEEDGSQKSDLLNSNNEADYFIPEKEEDSDQKIESKVAQRFSDDLYLNKNSEVDLLNTKLKPRKPRSRIRQGIFSKRCLKYCILMYCSMCKPIISIIILDIPSTFNNLIKAFSLYHQESLTENIAFWISVTYSVINGLGRSVFGFLYDRFGFKILRVTLFFEIVIGGASFFTSEIPWLFFMLSVIAALISASTVIVLPASVNKVFGLEVSSEVYGVIFPLYGLSALTSPIISKSMNIASYNTDYPYLILFEIGSALGLVGFLLALTMNEEPFVFDDTSSSKPKNSELKLINIEAHNLKVDSHPDEKN